ncbi:anaerobic nitric oxide reductase flavorubredoxin [Vibrio alginolyticus]|uniref:anaerobic nitric oxide reductase flavorubredoxin n=1 Tax=unclassified Vibrio TaxID=2614977 RepID=UPI001E456084|nr:MULTISPECIES: anaerobic nitric oxide reductase flavorubredoxin [unclassified Vibrio]EGQ9764711.1 anaerobic nitric oxide reductase flavorubredoxin [Vibrio alginolyticus]ELA9204655.1 anaerobic nitric oxide reductase flavorubredoxin [Vibrio alginolyticus]MCC9650710.1 anaerobic nitric oxide reductase flavorubredoxin [Vibrio sp. MA64]MDW1801016.1 anaerobic nitric oxide reductase flavorubredoxin [Vibrio sp. Vb2201]
MTIHVKNNIHWVGQRDWEVQDFHGTEYKMTKGTSYNSYLIREEKTVLIDTVDHRFSQQFIQNLEMEIDLKSIDFIVVNHAEEDHSGALSALMEKIPNTPIYCTEAAIDSIVGHHHHPEWNFKTVKTGDSIDIGNGKQLVFVEAPMLHWPDSMMTYLTGDAVLFSNDAFGQHYCDERLFNDEVDQNELMEQCLRYYSNILTPFSSLVTAKIKEVLSFNLPVDMIATSHGIVWRDNPVQIIEQYLAWADNYQEDRITIFYDSMSNNTRMMADAIAQGIHDVDPGVAVKVFNVSKHDKNEILANVFRSKGILVGSSTMNNVMMPKIAGMLEEITGLRFKAKKAAAFGSYGWNGGAVDRIHARLTDAGFETAVSLKTKWRPDGKAMRECREHGQNIAKLWAKHDLTSPVISPAIVASAPQVQSQPAAPATTQAVVDAAPSNPSTEAHPADCQCMVCTVCNWVYDPAKGEPNQGVEPGTAWSEVPDYFLCPECHLGKDVFVEYNG